MNHGLLRQFNTLFPSRLKNREGAGRLLASQFPSRSTGNPYINQLKVSLAEWGVACEEHDMYVGGRNTLPARPDCHWLAQNQGRIRILHFHWLQRFYRDTSPAGAERKVEEFAAFLTCARQLDYAIVYTFHNLLPHEGMGEALDRRVRELILRHAAAVTCFSRRQQEQISRHFGPLPLSAIPHPGYVGNYPSQLAEAECRRRLGLPAKAKVFTFIGLVRPYKDLARLIREFAELDLPDTYLVLAGTSLNPETDAKFAALAAGIPRLQCHLRWIEDAEMQVFLKSSDVVVLPYKQCWTSGAMLLAFSFGKPVVAADPLMLDQTAGLGFFYPAESELRSALLQAAAAEKQELLAMGQRCFQYARSHTWREAARKLAEIYCRTTGKPAGLTAGALKGEA
jgi:glycosyltransferase involved in cell wall biosynthesis